MVGISSGFQNSLVAQSLYGAQKNASSSMSKIASGNQFNRAADNVAALSIATQMSGELSGMRAQQQNAAMSQAMLQVADGGLNQIGSMLNRQQELAMQASSGALTNEQRGFLNQEFQALSAEINRIAGNTNFNGINLLGGGNGNVQLAQSPGTAAGLGAATNNANSANSTNPIEAFNGDTGASLNGAAGVGQMQFVDGNGNALTDFNNVNSAVVGNFDNFSISNVSYGTAATVTAEINGVQFSGVAADGANSVIVSDGSGTNIELSLSNFDLSSDASVNIAQSQLNSDFSNTNVLRTNTVGGANFNDTALEGVNGGAMLRIDDPSASISNFQYAGNSGANNNTLTVQVNGETFTATGVSDSINAGDVIRFEGSGGQALQIDFSGLQNNITDIRNNAGDRSGLINGLNEGFSRAGGASNAGIASGANDIGLSFGSASTNSLFNGQSLDISTAAGAANALNSLGSALGNLTSQRASIGSQMARVDSAASQLESSIGNIERARAALQDTDLADESTKLAAAQLRARMAAALAAQGNKMGNSVLNLLNG